MDSRHILDKSELGCSKSKREGRRWPQGMRVTVTWVSTVEYVTSFGQCELPSDTTAI
jgi:hypothetical protein